jgi:hypothetical protein
MATRKNTFLTLIPRWGRKSAMNPAMKILSFSVALSRGGKGY